MRKSLRAALLGMAWVLLAIGGAAADAGAWATMRAERL